MISHLSFREFSERWCFPEAAAYYGIGINKLRALTDTDRCPFVLWVGSKRLIKRKPFEKYLESQYSV